jgi:hypothetical protein
MTVRRLVIIACIAALLCGSPWLQRVVFASANLRPPATPIPATYFGLHIHWATQTDWPNIPFSAWRLTGDNVGWYDLEPKKGQWDFRLLDKDVDLAEKHHVQLMLTLVFTPTWASARPNEAPSSGHPGYTAEPTDINDWRDYVRTVATRYKGRIQAYEIWNEPNSPQFYTGSVEKLVLLAKEAYTILHQVDPSVIVASPPSAGSKVSFLDTYLRNGGGRYCDVIGYHFYVTPEPPEKMLDWIEQVKDIMAKYGQSNKPLWDTETGYYIYSQTTEVKPNGPFIVVPPDEAAAYVARAYILNWASGVSRLNWYGWNDDYMGLAASRGAIRKPAAEAYERVQQWLSGAVMRSCKSDESDTWVCEITRAGEYGGYIVWNPHGNKNFTIPGAWRVRWQVHLSGPNRNVSGAKDTEIGIKPILLENKAQAQ